MTELFSPNPKTEIKQGNTGDCYLLAVLDGFMNTSPEGLAFIKSLFRSSTDEKIVLRIKRSDLSANLSNKDLSHYHYYIDEETNEDVFIIDQKKLTEIENSTDGVQTDALAIKILEHIASYYYHNNWQSVATSIEAHSIRSMALSNGQRLNSIVFVQTLLNLDVKYIVNFNHLFLINELCPNLAIYASMRGSKFRHAFRFHNLASPNLQIDDASLKLWNPWDNQKLESYSLDQVIEPTFYLINTYVQEYDVACILLDDNVFLEILLNVKRRLSQLQDHLLFKDYDPELITLLGQLQKRLDHIKHTQNLSAEASQPLDRIMVQFKSFIDAYEQIKQLQIVDARKSTVKAALPPMIPNTTNTIYSPVANSIFKKPIKRNVVKTNTNNQTGATSIFNLGGSSCSKA